MIEYSVSYSVPQVDHLPLTLVSATGLTMDKVHEKIEADVEKASISVQEHFNFSEAERGAGREEEAKYFGGFPIHI